MTEDGEDGSDGGGSLGGIHQAEEKDSVSFNHSMGQVLVSCSWIRSQDTSANKQNPAQARIFKPRPKPREKTKEKKNFWLCGYVQ